LANARYLHMLRCLTQACGHAGGKPTQNALIDAAIDLMIAITPAATDATTLPARPGETDCTAGMSFAMTRALSPLPPGTAEWRMPGERFDEIAAAAEVLAQSHPRLASVASDLTAAASRFRDKAATFAEAALTSTS
jgi:hypothetical protein